MQEERKFRDYLESDTWPTGMDTIRSNLLRKTTIDEEIISNRGNDNTILNSLYSVLCMLHPEIAERQDSRQNRKGGSRDKEAETPGNGSSVSEEQFEIPVPLEPENQALSDEELTKKNLEEDRQRLRSKGIECYNMTYDEFISSQWNESTTLSKEMVDLVITEPPPSPSRSSIHSVRSSNTGCDVISLAEVNILPSTLRRVLKPGGYAILVMPFYSFMEWYNSFYDGGFHVMSAPYILAYDSNSVQYRRTLHFPQIGYKVAMIARLPSVRSDGFLPDFDSVFNLVQCSNARHCSIMFNIHKQKSPLCKPRSRMPFCTDELSHI